MYSFPSLEAVRCFMSISNCSFLTCIQVSQETGKMVWYSHLLKNFPQFVVIHTVKGFSIVNEEEVDVFFWHSLAFSMIQWMLAIWSLVPLPFLNPAWTSGSSHVLLKPGLENFELYFASMKNEWNCMVVWIFFGIALFGIGMKTDLFQSCGHCWVFQICWHMECNSFTAPSFRIWNSSAGIPSPPPALFIVMLPKAHLSLDSRRNT